MYFVMATKIEWADESWNPITGCTSISEGCRNCYARRMAKRLAGRFGYDGKNPFNVTLHADRLEKPLYWNTPRRIFVCTMGDLFHEDVPDFWIDEVVHTMMHDDKHTFMLLTKRPERMKQYVMGRGLCEADWIWFGITAENQQRADERVPILLGIPGAVRFVSIGPMLGPIYLHTSWLKPYGCNCGCKSRDMSGVGRYPCGSHESTSADRIDWIICGAETGMKAREMKPIWAGNIQRQCEDVNIPFFFKKMSGGKNPMPYNLNIREWPKGVDL